MGDRWNFRYCREEETFDNFLGGRKAIIKALTDDVEELCRQCDEYVIPENEYLGLYGFPNGLWQVKLSLDVPINLPHSILYKLPHQEEDKTKWLAKVAADSDIWLLTLTFALCGYYCYDKDWRECLFNKINELPTIYEVVTSNDKNQEVATEKAKKRVTDKSTFSGHCKALSNSEVQGMSSSILVKDLKREGKKANYQTRTPNAKCYANKIKGSWNSNKSTN